MAGPGRRHRAWRRQLAVEECERRCLLADLGVATPYNFFILGSLNEINASTQGRIAVGGSAELTNFGTATAHAGDDGGRGTTLALVSYTFLRYVNGTIHGDLHYNDSSVNLTNVAVTGTQFANSTPIDFAAARTSLINQSQFLATQATTGTVSVAGTTITLSGSPTNTLNVFSLSGSTFEAAKNGRLNITNVAPGATVLVNLTGPSVSMKNLDFEYNGVGGDQPFARQVLYNFPQATSLEVDATSPLGSILAPTAAVTGGQSGGHINGTLVAASLTGQLAGNEFLFQGDLPSGAQSADLAVVKSVDNATPNVGEAVTFTVTLSNAGPNTATGVQVSDLLPAGLQFVSAVPSQGTFSGTLGIWNVGAVDTTTPRTLTITAQVVSIAPQSNVATVTASDQPDPDPSNNTSTSRVTPRHADLGLSKGVDDPSPNVGETVTFTTTLSNLGPDTTTGVQVSDRLPAGLQFVAATPSQGDYDEATGTWTVGTVDTTTPQTLTITALVVSPNPRTNTATIASSDLFDGIGLNNTASVTVTPQQADLVLTNTVDVPRPNVGQTVTFTVTLNNAGPDMATGVQVGNLLPPDLQLIGAAPSRGTYNEATGTWTLGTVDTTTVQTLRITAAVIGPDPKRSIAAIIHSNQFDPNPGSIQGAVATVTPQQADLGVGKSLSNPAPNVGEQFTYTVSVVNGGPDTATNVTLEDVLPSQVTFVSASPSQGTYDPDTRIWTVGTVEVATPKTLTITVQVASPGVGVNTASVLHSDQFDPNAENNSAQAPIIVGQANLVLTKSVNDARPNVGENVTFTLDLRNTGPSTATNLVVSDVLAVGFEFVSAEASQGTYDNATGLWTVGTVDTATPQTLTITARLISPDPLINTAVATADQFDPQPDSARASITVTPQQADLAMFLSVDDAAPNVGETVTFTVTLNNLGPDTATGVEVSDLLPSGLQFDTATPSQGDYDEVTGTWTVGTVDTSTVQTLRITAVVVGPDPKTSTATVAAADQFDLDESNNSASAIVIPRQADLQLSKTVDNSNPIEGASVIFTVTLTNAGPDTATGVQVRDLLPTGLRLPAAGLELLAVVPSQGDFDRATGLWTVGTVDTTTVATLLVRTEVVGGGSSTNAAAIVQANEFDSVSDNNAAAATLTAQEADLALDASVSNPSPNVGETIVFTVTLSNNGPDPATSVLVSDLLPSTLRFVSAIPGLGTYDSTSGIWSVGTVDVTSPVTLRITASVASPNVQVNTASISHADQFDPVLDNNTANATATPQLVNLDLGKVVNDARPNVGDTITFTLTLSNTGPDAATDVAVSDPLPLGLAFIDAVASQGIYDASTGTWTVGTVSTIGTRTLAIRAQVDSPEPQTNTAVVIRQQQFDLDTLLNTATVTITPQQADLAVAVAVDNPSPHVGDTLAYTVTIQNRGPDTATGVVVAAPLSPGLAFVSASPSQGTFDPSTGTWTVGSVAGAATLVLQARAVEEGVVVLTANASALQFDPTPDDLSASVSTTVGAPLPATTVVGLQRFGFHAQPTTLVLTFSAGLDPASAEDVANYSLTLLAHAGQFRRSIRVAGAAYDPAARTVTLRFGRRLPLRFRYQIVIDGTPPGGLTDQNGRLIDGNGDGLPGSNFVSTFGRNALAGPNRPVRGTVVVHRARAVSH
jgi:choice-of-anchor A domain-containing protein/uncharacterized repeat protein (TIGR01451 family)